MLEETYSHQSCSASEETLLNPGSASSDKLIYHTFQNQTACKQSSQQSRKLGQVISELIAPALGLVLENKGSVARDHLASERTYLAYVRTSLACANAGVAIVQLLKLSESGLTGTNDQSQGSIDLQRFARPLGVIMVLSGLFIQVLGILRFFMTQAALLRGYFPVARNSLVALTFILGAVVSIVFMAVFSGMGG